MAENNISIINKSFVKFNGQNFHSFEKVLGGDDSFGNGSSDPPLSSDYSRSSFLTLLPPNMKITWQMLQKVLSLCDAERAEMNEDLELPLKLLEKAYFITTFLKFCYWHLFHQKSLQRFIKRHRRVTSLTVYSSICPLTNRTKYPKGKYTHSTPWHRPLVTKQSGSIDP